MSEHAEFMRCVLQRRSPIADVCAAYGISEKTGDKWLARFRCDGAAGLVDRSHAPHHVHRMDEALAVELLALRQAGSCAAAARGRHGARLGTGTAQRLAPFPHRAEGPPPNGTIRIDDS
jgi:transposase-like protein